MSAYLNKKENKSQSTKSSEGKILTGNKSFQLRDNRPRSVAQRKANTTGLPDNLKSGIENISGHSMDDVKVHYNSEKPAQLNAHAYAQGTDIHVASGQEKHLPHEAWHVVQQKQGRVKPTMQMKGKVNINDDAGLEKEADVMGAKALQRKMGENIFQQLNNQTNSTVAQLASASEISHMLTDYITIKSTLKEAISANSKEGIIETLRALLRHVQYIIHDTDYEIKAQAYSAIYDFLDKEIENISRVTGAREIPEEYYHIQDTLRVATSHVIYPTSKTHGASEAASGPEEAIEAPTSLGVPAYGGSGVSAKAYVNVQLADSSLGAKESSGTHQSGPWREDNHMRYYVKAVTKPAAGGDAEVKVLSEVTAIIQSRIGYGRGEIIGIVVLQTNLGPCKSCRAVIKQFKKDHPGITLRVQYTQTEAVVANSGNTSVGGSLGFEDAVKQGGFWVKEF